MPPITALCGLFHREAVVIEPPTPPPSCSSTEALPVAVVDVFEPRIASNKFVFSLDSAVDLTQGRVDHLWNVYNDNNNNANNISASSGDKTLYVIWQINSSRRDFKQDWLLGDASIVRRGLIDTNFPKLAVEVCLKHLPSLIGQTVDDDTFRWIENFLGVLIGYSDFSELFQNALGGAGAIEPLITLLSNSSLVIAEAKQDCRKEDLLEYALILLFNLARTPAAALILKTEFARLLEPYFHYHKINSKSIISLVGVMCAARIDSMWPEIANLDEHVLEHFFDFFTTAIRQENHRYRGIAVAELVESLRRMAITDQDKELLIRSNVLSLIVRPLLYSIDVGEQKHGVNLLFALCSSATHEFSGTCLAVLNDDASCMDPLKWLSSNADSDDLKQQTKRFLQFLENRVTKLTGKLFADVWLLKRNNSGADPSSSSSNVPLKELKEEDDEEADKPSIYLCYHRNDCQRAVKQLIRLLLANDWRVVNSELILNKSYDISAIEEDLSKADVVALCYSETYYLSLGCRREAELAASYHKKLISIRIDLQFTPPQNGWLNQMITTRCVFNADNDDALQKSDRLKELANKIQQQID